MVGHTTITPWPDEDEEAEEEEEECSLRWTVFW